MYPHDRILRKMILEEFKNTRIAKHPGEYEVFDSDEEEKILFPKKTGIKDFELGFDEKEHKLKEMFEMDMNEFKNFKLEKKKEKQQNIRKVIKEDKELHSYLSEKIQDYKERRKKRFEEKVPSLNEFLHTLYNEIRTSADLAMHQIKRAFRRNFPYRRWERLDKVIQHQEKLKREQYEREVIKSATEKIIGTSNSMG